MTDEDKLSQIEEKANDIIKNHNGVYLERKLYTNLKTEFPNLTRKDFQEVLSQLSQGDYVFERGLIRRVPDKESEKSVKVHVEKKPGKGDPESMRVPNKREV